MSVEWVVRWLPKMPRHRTERQWRQLSRRALSENLWAATVNEDHYRYTASEYAARIVELVDMIEGRRPVDQELLARVREHQAHVVECRTGCCEHEYAALVRAGVFLCN
jgi:hypothetical protein